MSNAIDVCEESHNEFVFGQSIALLLAIAFLRECSLRLLILNLDYDWLFQLPNELFLMSIFGCMCVYVCVCVRVCVCVCVLSTIVVVQIDSILVSCKRGVCIRIVVGTCVVSLYTHRMKCKRSQQWKQCLA
jgi:hypothetical protein